MSGSAGHQQIQRICEEVDKAFDRQVAFLSDLVREPSLWGEESGAQNLMFAAFDEAGLRPERQAVTAELLSQVPDAPFTVASPPGGFNVIGSRAGSGGGRSLILNGHIDVVPATPTERWNRDPFEPYVNEGWLYGRGSGDMKAGLTANLYAVKAIQKSGIELKGDVRLQSVIEEECTGNGTLACLAAGSHADAVLISEPAHGYLMEGQMGVMWVGVQVDGVPAHASVAMSAGNNAIEAAYHIWESVRKLQDTWNARSADYPPFTSEMDPVSFVIGTIAGGDWPSSVPARCNFEFRCGIYPGQRLEDAKREIENTIAQAANEIGLEDLPPVVSYPGLMAEGYAVQHCDEFKHCLKHAHNLTSDMELIPTPIPAGSDCRFYGNYAGIPALMYGPKSMRIHGVDECVELESLRQVTKAIALLTVDWCQINE